MPTTVHIIDDDDSFRTAMSRLLHASGYEVKLYESAQLLLDHFPGSDDPACILLDVQMPGLSGTELQDRLAKLGSALPIIFLTGHGTISMSVQAIKSGAEDFLTKPISKEKLLGAISRAVARYQTDKERNDQLKSLRNLLAKLTPREREVFENVVRGKMNKVIAHELGATERTIKAHRHRVMEKLQVQSIAELVSIAERLGVLAIPVGGNHQTQPQ